MTPTTAVRAAGGGTCTHVPPCPPATATNAQAARMMTDCPEQGWCLLCNGLILFDHQPLTGPVHAEGLHHFPAGVPDPSGYADPADCACGMTYAQYDAETGERILAALTAQHTTPTRQEATR